MARIAVRPLVGSGVTPNHLTTLRLLTGVLACAALLPGERYWNLWAGCLWLVSAFLDRADGELARLDGMCTPSGHVYDYVVDNFVNAAFFVAIGFGLRHSLLDGYAIGIGFWTGLSLYVCGYWSELLESRDGSGAKAYSGAFGFDPDDLLYLLSPIIWADWLVPLLVAASVGATFMMLLTGWRLQRLISRRRSSEAID